MKRLLQVIVFFMIVYGQPCRSFAQLESTTNNDTNKEEDFVLTNEFINNINSLGNCTFGDFSEGMAPVLNQNEKYGYIDKKGKLVIPFKFDEEVLFGQVVVGRVDNGFHDGLALVKKNGKCGFIDKRGNIVIPMQYNDAGNFNNGLAKVSKLGKWGFIDKKGNVVISIKYEFVGDFEDGLAMVQMYKKWGFIDRKGNIVIPIQYDNFYRTEKSYFKNDLIVAIKNGKSECLNKKGETLNVPVSAQYSLASVFCEGLARVIKDKKYGFIDERGNVVIQTQYDNAYDFNDGLAWVCKDRKVGFIDKSGNVVVPIQYSSFNLASDFNDGLAWVCKDRYYGFVDKNGKIAIPIQYSSVKDFKDGVAAVEKDGKYGYIDVKGNTVVPFIFNNVYEFSEGLTSVEIDINDIFYSGYLDKHGNTTFKGVVFDKMKNELELIRKRELAEKQRKKELEEQKRRNEYEEQQRRYEEEQRRLKETTKPSGNNGSNDVYWLYGTWTMSNNGYTYTLYIDEKKLVYRDGDQVVWNGSYKIYTDHITDHIEVNGTKIVDINFEKERICTPKKVYFRHLSNKHNGEYGYSEYGETYFSRDYADYDGYIKSWGKLYNDYYREKSDYMRNGICQQLHAIMGYLWKYAERIGDNNLKVRLEKLQKQTNQLQPYGW